jgi:hypothetical protein
MKIFILLIFISMNLKAVEITFIGPCDEDFIMKQKVLETYSNVGELTVGTLKKFNIPFIGTSEGMSSIFGTPTGDSALEVVSDIEMRAYGWCYSVDGFAPELYPHQVPVYSHTKSIVWHYGFARYYKGQWVSQCTPAHTIKPKFLCED